MFLYPFSSFLWSKGMLCTGRPHLEPSQFTDGYTILLNYHYFINLIELEFLYVKKNKFFSIR